MIYLDNAATTYPKPESVYDAMIGQTENYVLMLGEALTKRHVKQAK